MKTHHAGHVLGACALVCAAPAGATPAQIYGRLALAAEAVDVGGEPRRSTRLAGHRSVVGLRGEEALGEDWYTSYQIEGGVSLDTGQGGFTNRDTGLAIGQRGRWQLRLGHWATPYLMSTVRMDPHYTTTVGFSSFIGNGGTPSSDHFQNTTAFDRRQANLVQFALTPAPDWNLTLAYAPSETPATESRRPALWSFAAERRAGDTGYVLAAEQHRNYQAQGTADLGVKLAMTTAWADWQASVVLERLRYETGTGTLSRTSSFVALSRRLGQGKLHLSLATAGKGQGAPGAPLGFVVAGPDTGARQFTLGYDHALSPRTELFALVSRLKNDANARYGYSLNPVPIAPGAAATLLAAGIRTRF